MFATRLALLAVVLAAPAIAEDTRFYGPDGHFQSSAEQLGDTTRFYGADGTYQGEARTAGATTRFYARDGSFRGETRNASPDAVRAAGRRLFEHPSR